MKRKIETLLAGFFSVSGLFAFQVFNVSTFNHINSIVRYHDRLCIGTDGGVVLYSPSSHRVKATLVTEEPVILAVPDPLSPDIFFVEEKSLRRWAPNFINSDWLADLPGVPTSLGIDRDHLYIDIGGTIYKFSKIGVKEGSGEAGEDVLWCGERGSIREDDPSIAPLMPHFINSRTMGTVDMKVFYRDMDRLWVGTDGLGLYLYSMNTWQVRDSLLFGLVTRDVRAIYRDGPDLWFGGSGGVTRKSESRWIPYSRDGMLLSFDPLITDITGDSAFIWFGTDRGLLRFRKKDGSFWALSAFLPAVYVRSLIKAQDRLWISCDEGLFSVVPPAGTYSQIIVGTAVNQVLFHSGLFYYLTERGVYRAALERPASPTPFEDPRGWLNFRSLCGTSYGGRLFLVTEAGLVIYDAGRDTFSYAVPPISPKGADRVRCDASGGYFFLTSRSGLEMMRISDFHWRVFTSYDGLPDEEVLIVLADGDTLWVGTRKGLSVITGW